MRGAERHLVPREAQVGQDQLLAGVVVGLLLRFLVLSSGLFLLVGTQAANGFNQCTFEANPLLFFHIHLFESTHGYDFLPFSLPLSPDLHLLGSLRSALLLQPVTGCGRRNRKKRLGFRYRWKRSVFSARWKKYVGVRFDL